MAGHPGHLPLALRPRVQQRRRGDHHVVDVEAAEHQQVLLAPAPGLRLLGERGRHLLGEPPQLGRYGPADRADAAVLFTGDETEVGGLFADMAHDQLDAAVQALLAVTGLGERRPDHPVQAAQRLLDERHTERRGVVEVPVEGGGRDARGPRHLAQPEAAEALVLQESECGIQQCLTGSQLLGLADADGVTHAIQ